MADLRVRITIHADRTLEALRRLRAYAEFAARDAVEGMASETVNEARHIMGPVHPRGTPGAPFGAPPWRVTRNLSLSLYASPAHISGIDTYSAFAGPTRQAVYARVQELGRPSRGRYPYTHVNPHPYMQPAQQSLLASGVYAGIAYRTFADAQAEALR